MRKRIVVLMTVVALMVGMVALSVATVFAANDSPCSGNGSGSIVQVAPGAQYDRDGDGFICRYNRYDKFGALVDTRYRDDRAA